MKGKKRSLILRPAALMLCMALVIAAGTVNTYAAANGVYEGKEGWYFLTHDSTIQDYQGTNLYTQEQLDMILYSYLNMRDTLEENGMEFIVYLIPNKENVYSEYMPDTYGGLAPYTRIQQIYDLLKDEIRVIYPEETLQEAKERYPYVTYYKTDPHWNEIGTYICSKLLMEELGYDMPELEDLTITPYQTDNLTCAQLMSTRLPDIGYNITGYQDQEPCEERIIICGDSFGLQISECIEPVVNDCIIVHRDIFDPSMPYNFGATVVVLEILERFMDVIPIFSCV